MSTINNSPFELKESQTFGRYLVAKRDLPAGELIFREAPLFLYSNFSDTCESEKIVRCISCYRIVEKKKTFRCGECKWSTFCSSACTLDKLHRLLECPVLKENQVQESPNAIHYLFLLRVMQLKEKCIKKWNELINLTSTFPREDAGLMGFFDRSAEQAHGFLEVECNIQVPLPELYKLLKILKINAFAFVLKGVDETKTEIRCSALFATGCLLAHGCAPNLDAVLYRDTAERCTMALYTRQAIPVGTMVTLYYKGDYKFEGTRNRRIHLLEDFNFWCECQRCTDPTELGTFFSAVKCPDCEEGWQLPNTLNRDVVFKCDKCSHALNVEEVVKMEASFKEKLTNILAEKIVNTRRKNLDELIMSATSKYGLHPNHKLAYDAKERWVMSQNCDVLFGDSPDICEEYNKVVKRSEENLIVMNLFGLFGQRVTNEGMIGMAAARFYFKSRDFLSIGRDMPNLNEKIIIIRKIVHHFKQSVNVPEYCIYDEEKKLVKVMQGRYSFWNSQLTECLSQLLEENGSL